MISAESGGKEETPTGRSLHPSYRLEFIEGNQMIRHIAIQELRTSWQFLQLYC
jgi:hypothetical protein